MTKFTALIIIVALRIAYHPSPTATTIAPFTSPAPASTVFSIVPAKLLSLEGSMNNNKVILNWMVGDNETADQFEVEKSTDGKHFIMAALVFGTDKPTTDNYTFYEKASTKKIMYRIKLINKNKVAEYSDIIEINPAVNS
jgi:hypothetical protein